MSGGKKRSGNRGEGDGDGGGQEEVGVIEVDRPGGPVRAVFHDGGCWTSDDKELEAELREFHYSGSFPPPDRLGREFRHAVEQFGARVVEPYRPGERRRPGPDEHGRTPIED